MGSQLCSTSMTEHGTSVSQRPGIGMLPEVMVGSTVTLRQIAATPGMLNSHPELVDRIDRRALLMRARRALDDEHAMHTLADVLVAGNLDLLVQRVERLTPQVGDLQDIAVFVSSDATTQDGTAVHGSFTVIHISLEFPELFCRLQAAVMRVAADNVRLTVAIVDASPTLDDQWMMHTLDMTPFGITLERCAPSETFDFAARDNGTHAACISVDGATYIAAQPDAITVCVAGDKDVV
jgi:hypothetical protein